MRIATALLMVPPLTVFWLAGLLYETAIIAWHRGKRSAREKIL